MCIIAHLLCDSAHSHTPPFAMLQNNRVHLHKSKKKRTIRSIIILTFSLTFKNMLDNGVQG